ncbi:MAG TPA: roadblock/LC7 domain-containing protein [Armatimonadota bacterium]|jgi:predicted regulator of Ras-like GTPase activity (Roadblock/LC7/MglB family)
MLSQPLIITYEHAALLDHHLRRFAEDTGADTVLLTGCDGTMCAAFNRDDGIDIELLCALAVGTFNSSNALAALAGEDEFTTVYQQSGHGCIYITSASTDFVLLAQYSHRPDTQYMRLLGRITSEAVVHVLELAQATTQTRLRKAS